MWKVTYSDGTIDEFSDDLTIELAVEYADSKKSIIKIEKIDDKIKKPTFLEIFVYEFIVPMIENQTMISSEELKEILEGNRDMTEEISDRLGWYFNMSSSYFLNLFNNLK